MGRKWLLMVPAMSAIDSSCPPHCPSTQSALTTSAREEEEEALEVVQANLRSQTKSGVCAAAMQLNIYYFGGLMVQI